MLWKDRLMSAVLAILVTAAAGAALWRFAPEKPRFTPGQLLSGITYEATGVPSDEIVYSIDGNLKRVAANTYIITPNNVDISNDLFRTEEKKKQGDSYFDVQ